MSISKHWVVSWTKLQQLLCSALEGMLMPTAGASYRHLIWETGAEHQQATAEACVLVGTLRRRSSRLSSQREASQGSHQEHLTLGSHAGDLKQGNTQEDISAMNNTGLSIYKVILLYKQTPVSGDGRISMILSVHPSSKL